MYKYILTLLVIAFSEQIQQDCNIARLIREEIDLRKFEILGKQEKLSKIITPALASFASLRLTFKQLKSDASHSEKHIETLQTVLTRFYGIEEFDPQVDRILDLVDRLEAVLTVAEYDDILYRVIILADQLRAELQRLQIQYQTEVEAFEPLTEPQLRQQAQSIQDNCQSLETADLFAALTSNTKAFTSASGINLDIDGDIHSIGQGNYTTSYTRFAKWQGFTIEDNTKNPSFAMGFSIAKDYRKDVNYAFKINIFGTEIEFPPTESTSSCHPVLQRTQELSPEFYIQATNATSIHVSFLDKVYGFSCSATARTNTLRLDVTEGTLGIFRLAYYRSVPEKPYTAILSDQTLWQGQDINCLSQWTDWSDCDSPTGLSVKTRRSEIKRLAWNGGEPCSEDYFQVQTCQTTPTEGIIATGIYQYPLVKSSIDSTGLSSDIDRNIVVDKSLVINFQNHAKMLSTEYYFTLEVAKAPFTLFDVEQNSQSADFSMQMNQDKTVTIKIGRKTIKEAHHVGDLQLELKFGEPNTITNLVIDATLGYQKPCAKGCEAVMNGDGVCNQECANLACDFDQGDCQSNKCNDKCVFSDINNGICNQSCHTEECSMDGADCQLCQTRGCSLGKLGNGVCDYTCNNKQCEFDWGDCNTSFLSFI